MSLARPMSSLSVIIITKNEANNIRACLESVRFADEIIVLDSGSTDETIPLCQLYTDKVYSVDWPGFGPQKNRALSKCESHWVLSIDADEIVSPQLANEIQQIIQTDSIFSAYSLTRKSNYCNQYLIHGDWRNDRCIRLFKREHGSFSNLPVHEGLVVNGKVGALRGLLLHNSFADLEEVLNKVNHYSTLSAEHKYTLGKKSSLTKAIIHGLWTFIRGYVLKAGFLDGKKGFMLAVSNAEGCYYRYLKIMLLTERESRA